MVVNIGGAAANERLSGTASFLAPPKKCSYRQLDPYLQAEHGGPSSPASFLDKASSQAERLGDPFKKGEFAFSRLSAVDFVRAGHRQDANQSIKWLEDYHQLLTLQLQ